MKKLLSLLLTLVLCLGMFVACDTSKEASSGSSNEGLPAESTRPSGDEKLKFYYYATKKADAEATVSESFELAKSYLEYSSFVNTHNLPLEVSEENFNNVYIFLAQRKYNDELNFLGYYGLGSDKNGYWITAGYNEECHVESFMPDGTISHYTTQRVPFSEDSSTKGENAVAYDVVVVFKSELGFEMDSSKPIEVYKKTYHFKY